MVKKTYRRHQKSAFAGSDVGFTLMEILIAILILSVVVTTVLASFNMVFSTTEALDSDAAVYESARICLNQMAADLGQIHISQRPLYRPPQLEDPPDPYRIEGVTEDIDGTAFAQLRFASRNHVPPPERGSNRIAQIWYYVQSSADGRFVLRRSDRLYPYPELEKDPADAVLCTDVKSLAFTYTDHEGSEVDSWNSDQDDFEHSTPRAVHIRLEIGRGSSSRLFETSVQLPVARSQNGAKSNK
jgi:general secretion pathway protein J